MRQPAGATRRRREDVTTRRQDNERVAHREAKQHTAGATRGQGLDKNDGGGSNVIAGLMTMSGGAGLGGMGPGGGDEEDAATVRQWRREGKSAYHNAPVAVAVAVAVVAGDNNIGVPGNQGRGPTQENA